MSDTLKHGAYNGSVLYSDEDQLLHGRVLGIRDMITYEGETIKKLKANFVHAVDEYVRFCEAQGKKPDAPFKGTFNVRLGRELHTRAALLAVEKDKPLNQVIHDAVEEYLSHAN